jgi:hypothetical protein
MANGIMYDQQSRKSAIKETRRLRLAAVSFLAETSEEIAVSAQRLGVLVLSLYQDTIDHGKLLVLL